MNWTGGEATRTTKTGQVDVDTSHALQGGALLLRALGRDQNGEPVLESEIALTNLEGLPDDLDLSYRQLENETSSGNKSGFDRLDYVASAPGAGMTGHLRADGTRINIDSVGLPMDLHANISADRKDGWISTDASQIASLDLTVKPDDNQPYDQLGEDEEGILASEVGQKLAHIQIDDLREAWWNLSDDGLTSGSNLVHVAHRDQSATKAIRFAIQSQADDGDNQTISGRLSDIPEDWNLTLDGGNHVVDLHYNATETLPKLWLDWRKGQEYVNATLHGLGKGETDLTIDAASGWDIDFSAANPPTLVKGRTMKAEDYAVYTLTDLAPAVTVEVDESYKEGLIEATDGDGVLTPTGEVEFFHATCEDLENGTCSNEPPSWDREDFPENTTVFRHEYIPSPNAPNQAQAGNVTDRTYALTEGVKKVRWVLDGDTSENWFGVLAKRNGSLGNTTIDLDVLGTESNPDLTFDTAIPDAPANVETIAHVENASAIATNPAEVPDGFSLDHNVNEGDIYLEIDSSADRPIAPRISFESLNDTFAVTGVNETFGFPDGSIQLSGSSGGQDVAGFDGTIDLANELKAAQVTWQHHPTDSPDGTEARPFYAMLQVEDLPSHAEISAWKTPDVECPGAGCTAEVSVDVPAGEKIGWIDLYVNLGTAQPERIVPSLPDVEVDDLDTSQAAPEYVHWHSGRQAADGTFDPDALQFGVDLVNASDVTIDVAEHLITGDADILQTKDLDIYYSKAPSEPSEANVHYTTARFRDVAGAVDFTWDREPLGGDTKLRVTMDPPAGSSDTSFDAAVQGNLPFGFRGLKAEDYWFTAKGLSSSLDLEVLEEDPATGQPAEVDLRSTVDRLRGEIHLTRTPANPNNPPDCDPSEGTTRLQVSINRDDAGVHTGDRIGMVNISAFTGGALRTSSFLNHYVQTKSCAHGQVDELSTHLTMYNLSKAYVDLVKGDETMLDLETVFSSDREEPRPFQFIKSTDGEPTNVRSQGWPDVAGVHYDSTPLSIPGPDLPAVRTWLRGSGGLPGCPSWLSPLGHCWKLHLTMPLDPGDPGGALPPGIVDFETTVQGGIREDVNVEVIEAGASYVADVDSDYADWIADMSLNVARGAGEDISSWFTFNGTGDFTSLFDLDGVASWADELPFFISGDGKVRGSHSSQGYSIDYNGTDDGAFHDTTLWLDERPKDPDNPGAGNETVAKRGGWERYNGDPTVVIDSEGQHYRFPDCVWYRGACDADGGGS